ncbi:MAG TPA: sigma-70 family RNA polymerase sigma factor [Rhizomicrobium sp.]|jgi:RNA polymerase sigma-70 factor (ECF subfamily)
MEQADLIARLIATQDIDAFGVLVRKHQSAVRGFLARLARGDGALADDLAQETFLEALRKLHQFRGDGPFRGWLLRIAWSRFLMEARRRKFLAEPDEDSVGSAGGELAAAAKLDLERAMARLSASERAALTLHFALGYSHEETASIMDVPLGTAKSHVLRGRERLKALLEGWSERSTP